MNFNKIVLVSGEKQSSTVGRNNRLPQDNLNYCNSCDWYQPVGATVAGSYSGVCYRHHASSIRNRRHHPSVQSSPVQSRPDLCAIHTKRHRPYYTVAGYLYKNSGSFSASSRRPFGRGYQTCTVGTRQSADVFVHRTRTRSDSGGEALDRTVRGARGRISTRKLAVRSDNNTGRLTLFSCRSYVASRYLAEEQEWK